MIRAERKRAEKAQEKMLEQIRRQGYFPESYDCPQCGATMTPCAIGPFQNIPIFTVMYECQTFVEEGPKHHLALYWWGTGSKPRPEQPDRIYR